MTVSQKLIENVKELRKSLNEISVYDLDVHTSMDLYYTIAKKFNIVIKELSRFEGVVSDEVIKQNEKLVYLLGEGLNTEVVNKINNMIIDGTIDNIINTNLFNDLNSQIKDIASQLETIEVHVSKFGATGDGITNDTQAIKDAMNYCAKNKIKKIRYR